MKFRVIFLKKRYIYYLILAVALIILLICILIPRKSSPTFSATDGNVSKRTDLTGDGKEDILFVKTQNNNYYLEVNANDKSYNLDPCNKSNTLGTFYTYYPMNLTLIDISRDNVPEIFTQAYSKDGGVQHVFFWYNKKFQDIFCSNDNVLGFMDCKNNRTPKFISGNLSNNSLDFTSYVLIKDNLQKFTFNYKDNYMGKDSVFKFVKYVESMPYNEANKPVDVFYPGMSGKDLSVLGKICSDCSTMTFQCGNFMDTKWDKSGNSSEITWNLSFKSVSKTNSKDIKNNIIQIKLKPDISDKNKEAFKIFSITQPNN